jgi:ankyrin repeat protein
MTAFDNSLLVAAERGDMAGVRNALSAGANPNACLEGGTTALHMAVFQRRPDIAIQLLLAGADVHREDTQGRSPMRIARARANTLPKGRV